MSGLRQMNRGAELLYQKQIKQSKEMIKKLPILQDSIPLASGIEHLNLGNIYTDWLMFLRLMSVDCLKHPPPIDIAGGGGLLLLPAKGIRHLGLICFLKQNDS